VKFRRSVRLAAAIEKVFEFHADPHNIGKVSPRGLSVEVLASHPQARAGDQFTLRVRQLGIPLLWRGQWEKVESPSLLVDSAKVFPFSYWRHEHRFTAANSETEMTDNVHFKVHWFLGGVLAERFIAGILFPLMFSIRHRRTRRVFE
jgi:ligand-binding SRPBCC domain-containing protein